MSEDKYGPIPGVMDTIDCLRKEIEDLKSKLSEAELRFQAARKRWVEHLVISGTDGLDGFGFSEVEDARAYVDQEISAELLRLQEAERQSRLKQGKK